MPATRISWHDVLTMPEDGNRYEAIGGELHVTPASECLLWVATTPPNVPPLPKGGGQGVRTKIAPGGEDQNRARG